MRELDEQSDSEILWLFIAEAAYGAAVGLCIHSIWLLILVVVVGSGVMALASTA